MPGQQAQKYCVKVAILDEATARLEIKRRGRIGEPYWCKFCQAWHIQGKWPSRRKNNEIQHTKKVVHEKTR